MRVEFLDASRSPADLLRSRIPRESDRRADIANIYRDSGSNLFHKMGQIFQISFSPQETS